MPRDRQLVTGRPLTTPAGIADKTEAEALQRRLNSIISQAQKALADIEQRAEELRHHTVTIPLDHPDESVTTEKIAAGAVTAAKVAADVATQAELNTVDADLQAHKAHSSNPHNVTVPQVVASSGGATSVPDQAALPATATFGDVDTNFGTIVAKLNALLDALQTLGIVNT
jgi:hypothetical protein